MTIATSSYLNLRLRSMSLALDDIERGRDSRTEADQRMERGAPWMRCRRCEEWCWPDPSLECRICRRSGI